MRRLVASALLAGAALLAGSDPAAQDVGTPPPVEPRSAAIASEAAGPPVTVRAEEGLTLTRWGTVATPADGQSLDPTPTPTGRRIAPDRVRIELETPPVTNDSPRFRYRDLTERKPEGPEARPHRSPAQRRAAVEALRRRLAERGRER